jgi:delta-aminolevulinic acid dehydratase/porphobilinogen synthase
MNNSNVNAAINYGWIATTATVTTALARRAGAGWILALGAAFVVTTLGTLELYREGRL